MIILVTGSVGSGKTWTTLAGLAGHNNLSIYLLGFVGNYDLNQVNHKPVPEFCGFNNWPAWLPDGSLLVIDEFQNNLSDCGYISDSVAISRETFSVSDFIFITQSARSIPKSLLNIVDIHRHVERRYINQNPFTVIYEWDYVADPSSKSDLNAAVCTRIYAKGEK